MHDPDEPENFPRNLFVWRSNLLGSSGKGHEYFLKHLLGAEHGVQGKDLGASAARPQEVKWHEKAPEGKLDLVVTLDFRMSTTCLYSDIVLPTATWYEKDDMNTSDMHPFIHPLSAAVDPAWESRSDWDIYKGIARSSLNLAEVWAWRRTWCCRRSSMTGRRESAQAYGIADWGHDECDPVPGKTMGSRGSGTRLSEPLRVHLARAAARLLGNGGKGITWNRRGNRTARALNYPVRAGVRTGGRRFDTISTPRGDPVPGPGNQWRGRGQSMASLSAHHGQRSHASRAPEEDEKIRFRDIRAAAQDHLVADLERHRIRKCLL